jgi:hypothetical protein
MRRAAQFLTGIVGLGIAGLGLLVALAYLLLTAQEPPVGLIEPSPALQNTVAFALAALSVGLGLPLAWTAFRAFLRKPSPLARLPSPGLLAGAFIVTVALGQAVVSLRLAEPFFLPPLHALASFLPPFLILSAVVRPLVRAGVPISRRDLALNLAHGGFIATTGAGALEMLAIAILFLLALLVLALTPGGMASVQTWADQLGSPEAWQDLSWLRDLARNPWIVAAAGGILVIVAPASEEALKGLGVLLLGYRCPGRAQAFAWGVAGGAGFALAEGLFNGALGLQNWGLTIVMRAATAVIHAVGGGLTGLGWQSLLTTRRPWRALGFYLYAVALHGLWNAAAGGIALLGLRLAGNLYTDPTTLALGGLGTLLLFALQGLVWLAALGTLIFWTRRLRHEGAG